LNSSELYQIMLDLTRDKHGRTSIKNIRPIKINFFVSYPYWSPIRIENQNTNEIEKFPYELGDYDSRLNAIRRANELIKKNRHKLRKQGKYDELEKPIPEFCLEVIMDYGDTEPGRSIDKKAIDNEELFKLKDDDDFIPRLNRTMYEYLILKKESAQAEGRWDEKNIWYTPYRNFGDWFDKHPKYGDAKPYFEEEESKPTLPEDKVPKTKEKYSVRYKTPEEPPVQKGDGELASAHNLIKRQKKKIQALRLRKKKPTTEMEMVELIIRNLKKNGKCNNEACGREVKVDGETIKRWIREFGLTRYATNPDHRK